MLTSDFRYSAYVEQVIDGDTFKAHVILADKGFYYYDMAILKFRLKDIDTWEKFAIKGDQEHKAKGLLAKEKAKELIEHRWVVLESHKAGKYGRWLAVVEVEEGVFLAELLRQDGHEKVT